ncbi:hypothetical protein MLD38_008352 [Melastoma candidum]|uniref:Uncharacterized protein n=1 Tax=Melastoma candidum TaxID=119954 RepID=A0ACB9RTN6_9MYRT|nr:hypothetical protein MLD38_008352 [Melastoma candidum]
MPPPEEFPCDLAREEENDANFREGTLLWPYLKQLRALDSKDPEKESGCKTPTSPGHKILGFPGCPRAPRKPKVKKRMRCPVVLLDMTEEIEAIFPMGAGRGGPSNGNGKRVKVEDKCHNTTTSFKGTH